MISVIAQERVLGASLGTVFVGAVLFEQRRGIYSSISRNGHTDDGKAQHEPKPIIGKKLTSEFAHFWNKGVDETLGQLVAYLSSRRW